MNELNIIRDAIVKALQASDYSCPSIKAARSMVKNNVHLGRLDPGQWCPEALVIALTEDGLPSPCDYEFWQHVSDLAKQNGCEIRTFDVTHFAVGFFRNTLIAADVERLIALGAKDAEEIVRKRLEYAIENNNISSPIEQLFFTGWEISRQAAANDLDPQAHGLSNCVLYPRFPIQSDIGAEYLIDFCVLEFSPNKCRKLVVEWRDRQDPYSDGNWIADPYPEESDGRCNVNLKIGIELDSYKYHVEELSKSAFEYQKRRERYLQQDQWTMFSFCGSEVFRDPLKCVAEVRRYLASKKIGLTSGS